MIIDQPRSWQYSKEHCIQHGGHLASVHSGIENGFIQGDHWTGLIKVQPGGQRHWTDGTAYDYTNWGDGGKSELIYTKGYSSYCILSSLNFAINLYYFYYLVFQNLMTLEDTKTAPQ